jgi:hypothetical protein
MTYRTRRPEKKELDTTFRWLRWADEERMRERELYGEGRMYWDGEKWAFAPKEGAI